MSMSSSRTQDARPDTSHLITEDGEPVDSFLSEKQMRLLTAPLEGWVAPGGRRFLAAMNVGVFATAGNPPLVPDAFVSFDVDAPLVTGPDRQRSYFVWDFGKPPDIVIEIVSDEDGGELTSKLRAYERIRVTHYVVFDPLRRLGDDELHAFTLQGGVYVARSDTRFAVEGLALVRWEGAFEDVHASWLRWAELDGRLIPTVKEEKARADAERERADAERERADAERERADALAARLRALGMDPDR